MMRPISGNHCGAKNSSGIHAASTDPLSSENPLCYSQTNHKRSQVVTEVQVLMNLRYKFKYEKISYLLELRIQNRHDSDKSHHEGKEKFGPENCIQIALVS